jgi:hypothetical protein
METGVLGVPFPLAVSLAEWELKTAPDFAIIQFPLLEEQFALDQAQKMLLAMPCHVQWVK